MKIIKAIIAIILIIFSILALINKSSFTESIVPFLLIGMGVLNILNSYQYYRDGDKTESIITLLIGSLIFILGLLILTRT